jgi:excisionase family DNA binding protein
VSRSHRAAALRLQADALELQARALRAEADAIEAEADQPANGNGADAVYLTVEEAARRFNVSKRTIFDWVAEGMPSVKRGCVRRVPVVEATVWLRARGH